VIDNLSGTGTPKKIGPMLKARYGIVDPTLGQNLLRDGVVSPNRWNRINPHSAWRPGP